MREKRLPYPSVKVIVHTRAVNSQGRTEPKAPRKGEMAHQTKNTESPSPRRHVLREATPAHKIEGDPKASSVAVSRGGDKGGGKVVPTAFTSCETASTKTKEGEVSGEGFLGDTTRSAAKRNPTLGNGRQPTASSKTEPGLERRREKTSA